LELIFSRRPSDRRFSETGIDSIQGAIELSMPFDSLVWKQRRRLAGKAQAVGMHADQANGLKRFNRPPIEQDPRRSPEQLRRIRRLIQRHGTADGLEIAKSNLQTHAARAQVVLAQSPGDLLDMSQQYMSNLLRIGNVNLERLFLTDAPGLPIGSHRPFIPTKTEVKNPLGVGCELAIEPIRRF
jgi:hypothetical protein